MKGGYEFPVYTAKSCPRNEAEIKKRSSAINCSEENGYLCIPDEYLTSLLEFCYIHPQVLIPKGEN